MCIKNHHTTNYGDKVLHAIPMVQQGYNITCAGDG